MRAVDVVRKVAKNARPEYIAAFENGDRLLSEAGINTPLRLAHFLAQVMHESGGLTVQFENMNYRARRINEIFGEGVHSAAISPSEAEHLAGKPSALAERVYGVGNPKKSREFDNRKPGDGFKYRGGGILQTTGKKNYRRMGELCGVDFENHPELIVSPEHALKPALAEWTECKLNALADKSDLRQITRKINGGYNGLADREAWFRKIRPLIDEVEFEFKPEIVKPKPPPDVEPTPKPAGKSKTILAAILAAIVTALTEAVDKFVVALTDWRWLAVLAVIVLLAYVIWERNKKPDIRGWF